MNVCSVGVCMIWFRWFCSWVSQNVKDTFLCYFTSVHSSFHPVSPEEFISLLLFFKKCCWLPFESLLHKASFSSLFFFTSIISFSDNVSPLSKFCTKTPGKKSRALKLHHQIVILKQGSRKNVWESHTRIYITTSGQHIFWISTWSSLLTPIISSLSHNALPASSPHPVSSKPRTSEPCFEIRKWKKVSVFGRVRNHSSINTAW